MSGQFHFDATTYEALIRSEVVDYDALQTAVADAIPDRPVERVLDLGAGTGQTSLHVLGRYPNSQLVLLDESPDMLSVATRTLPSAHVEAVLVRDLRDPLPVGPFDLIVSCLAIHHLFAPEKGELFGRVADQLTPRGCFVMGDVVIPKYPGEARIPLEPDFDHPSSVDELLELVRVAPLQPTVTWQRADLVVIRATVF